MPLKRFWAYKTRDGKITVHTITGKSRQFVEAAQNQIRKRSDVIQIVISFQAISKGAAYAKMHRILRPRGEKSPHKPHYRR